MDIDFELHPKQGELRPQRNTRGDESTRENALELEFDESTIINVRVSTVQYGEHNGNPAALIVLRFIFKFRSGSKRVRSFNVRIEFVPHKRVEGSSFPKVEALAPEDGEGMIFGFDHTGEAETIDGGLKVRRTELNGWKQGSDDAEDNIVVWDCNEAKGVSTGVIRGYQGIIIIGHQKNTPFEARFMLHAERGFLNSTKRVFDWVNVFNRKEKDDPVVFYPGKPIGPCYSSDRNLDNLDLNAIANYSRKPQLGGTQLSISSSTPKLDISKTGNRTFRVTQIPATFQKNDIQQALNPGNPDIVVIHSLTVDAEHTSLGGLQTATISELSSCDALSGIDSTKSRKWSFQNICHVSGSIRIDRSFLGMTVLQCPQGEVLMDLVAVCGLNGHPFGSWKEGNGDFMWLRDGLGKALSKTRVMIYGYDTTLSGSNSFANLSDYGKMFLEATSLARSNAGEAVRPITFVGHSLGGLLIKEALVHASRSHTATRNILAASHGLVFLGVPHRGLKVEHLMAVVEGQPNQRFIESLEPDSPYLEALKESFQYAVEQSPVTVHSWYETAESKTLIRVDGVWKLEGPPVRLVSQSSATNAVLGEQTSSQHAMNRSHSEMAKFDENDPYFKHLRDQLRNIENRFMDGSLITGVVRQE